MKRLVSVLVLAALVAVGAAAQIFDFTIVNKTGYTIDEIYVSPADDDEWGDDVMDTDVLKNGASVEIEFDEDFEDILLALGIDLYDLRCVYEDESEDIWSELKLETISQLTLTLDKKGNGVATWK